MSLENFSNLKRSFERFSFSQSTLPPSDSIAFANAQFSYVRLFLSTIRVEVRDHSNRGIVHCPWSTRLYAGI